MTAPPLPPGPLLRVRLDYDLQTSDAGSRFYMTYTGTTPTATVLNSIASDIATEYTTALAPQATVDVHLVQITVEDITTLTGATGVWTGSVAGSNGGSGIPSQCAAQINFEIARRYRGGKPRMYGPFGKFEEFQDTAHWMTSFTTAMTTAITAFFAALSAISESGTALADHVNASYYSGFHNVTNSSGRIHAAPTYRSTILLDPVTGYDTATRISSQRRRRTASTF